MIRAATLLAIAMTLLAGPGWAGEGAWQARYRIRDAGGERELQLLRADDRIEYRVAGQPVRAWRKIADGIELSELYPEDRRKVVYSPGDLRTLGREPDWAKLSDPLLSAPACNGKPGEQACPVVVTLLSTQRVDAGAFTDAGALLEIDQSDLGDMQLDPFARRLSHGH